MCVLLVTTAVAPSPDSGAATVPPAAWPLSAAATAVLRAPRLSGEDALKLALKELVLRRVWSLERRPVGLLRRKRAHFVFGPAEAPGLPPLVRADAALRSVVGSSGRDVGDAVAIMLQEDRRLPDRVRDDARAELAAAGLVVLERRKLLGLIPRTVVMRTQAGDAWVAEAARMQESAPSAAALGGLVLLDDAFKRRRDRDVGTTGYADSDETDYDLLDALGADFDSAVDEGVDDADGDDE
jgi:hypothetical protein